MKNLNFNQIFSIEMSSYIVPCVITLWQSGAELMDICFLGGINNLVHSNFTGVVSVHYVLSNGAVK